jgi:predicted phage baseplate assembly protein
VESFALSSPEDRHYIVDKINGTVSFSNGKNGRIPTSGDSETILVEYSCGGGAGGNLEPGRLIHMDRSIGFINQVMNHEITTGGCSQETVNESLLRNAAAIKHGYRAVTASDYEALALEATRNILKAKCIPNCNSNGEREFGSVTLVILQKDFIHGRKYFDSVKTEVINYIGPRMSSNLTDLNKFHVVEPRFIEINVDASVVVREYDQVFDVKNKVLQRIKEFIDPTGGNFNHMGWEIGTVPNSTQILNTLKDIKDIVMIKNIRISGHVRSVSGTTEVDLERKDTNRFVLPINGRHEIFVEVK